MIRSRLLNGLVLLVGLFFAAVGLSYLVEVIRVRAFGRSSWLVPLVFALFDLGIAAWCCLGAAYNFRHRRDAALAEPRGPSRAVKVLLFLAVLSIVALFGACEVEIHGLLGASTGWRLIQVAMVGLALEIVAIPVVVLWYRISQRRQAVTSGSHEAGDRHAA